MDDDKFRIGKDIFEQMHKSRSDLGETLSNYERITQALNMGAAHSHLNRITDNLNKHASETHRRLAEERAEEMELTRLTGRMTAESAKMLSDLVGTGGDLMKKMDDRDASARDSMKKQITIAMWSVILSAVLALCALVVSSFSFLQDQASGSSQDLWQTKLLTVIEQGIQQRSAAEHENEMLKEQMGALEARILDLEAAQRAAAANKIEGISPPHAAAGGAAPRR